MAKPGKMGRRGVVQISEVANALVDPVLARRAGIDTMLLGSWDEIAGEAFADCSRPEKIAWPRRGAEMEGEGENRPGTLTVACEGSRALFLAHAEGELISRINAFFGFPAIGRIRIVQKPVAPPVRRRPPARALTGAPAAKLADLVSGIEDDRLKAALARLGTAVLSARR
ncbi:DUF721 domain-containing protein [Rhizobium sp. CC-YZS058]|uniref:DUF721 domain-containing protein n=1 Tax=Rhizobium sp. CC-YZS058 TaxID=3042153 RepID=UPI002B0567BA|nr:DciA family protein [Rhizobium sp. CC-YZS058]MEA3535658.1 DciA family protein [Rhizobium sp. CC-YZS058]